MSDRARPEPKTALTFEQKITCAYLHYVVGLNQHDIALAYAINQGRVNEACKAIEKAAEEA